MHFSSGSMTLKFSTRSFLASLITNPSLKFKDSKWRIQYGRRKCKQSLDWDEIWYSGVFGVNDYEYELNIQNFKMANPIWLTKM